MEVLKVIFLDIDGVLLPFPKESSASGDADALFPASTVEALGVLLRETKAKVVLSSTWRVREDFIRDIVDCIRGFGIDFDGFFDTTDPNMHSERQWEIHRWLSDHQPQYGEIIWIALDDEDLIEGEANTRYRDTFRGHVVRTESHKGLTKKDVANAVKLWKSQL